MNKKLIKTYNDLSKVLLSVDFDLDTMTEIKKPILVKKHEDNLTITTEDPENYMALNYYNEYGYLSESDGVHPEILKVLEANGCKWEWMWPDAMTIFVD